MSTSIPEASPAVEKKPRTTTETKDERRARKRREREAKRGAKAPPAKALPAEDARHLARDIKFTAFGLRELLSEMEGLVSDLEAQGARVKVLGGGR